MTDDSITRFARHYRLEAAAVLVQIAKDESAPPQARAAAAEKILAYSDGRPGAARSITVADLELMDDEQRQDLLHALLTRYELEMPGQFKQMMEQAYVAAMQRMATPRPNRFTRGDGAGQKQIRYSRATPAPKQADNSLPHDLSLKNGHAPPA